jgi:NADPH-dependent glutamate synthase beta subunit-like oxidoreductase
MPGSKKEVKNAREEGAEFLFNVQPQFIQLDAQGHFAGIGLIRTELGEPDSSGRRRPQVVAGSEFVLEADALIIAFGFSAHSMPWLDAAKVKCNRWGLIEAPRNSRFPCQTSHPQIFAGGDIVRGADLVVTAMSDGRKAALGIIASLGLELQSVPPIQ